MVLLGWCLLCIIAWIGIGVIHCEVRERGVWETPVVHVYIKTDYTYGTSTKKLHPDFVRLMRQDAIVTIVLGPIGIVLACMNQVAKNWPECLVIGGAKTTPAIAVPAAANDDVDLTSLMKKAGIYKDR